MRRTGMDPFRAGVIALVVIAAGTWLGFAKRLPFGSEYELRAVVAEATQVHRQTPVRIAGVEVGRVKRVERGPGATAIVTMAIRDAGRPVHTDATLRLRPRLFLEGNFFIDLRPGTASAPELADGGTIPLAQTATPVQLDQVLTTLNASTREQLTGLLGEYAVALRRGGAEAVNGSLRPSGPAFRGVAIVAEAARGERPDDLRRLVSAQADLLAALASRRERLADLVTSFARTADALAARRGAVAASVRGLGATMREAGPALAAVNGALPAARAFATEVRPALRAAPRTLDLANPLLRELTGLVGPDGLPALVAELRPALRTLARLEPRLVALFDLVAPVTACVRDNALPVLTAKLDDGALSTGRPVWQDLLHGTVGLAGASQNFDANGPAVRYLAGGGEQLFSTGQVPGFGRLYGVAPEPIAGSRPRKPAGPPPFRPDAPCAEQAVPDLRAQTGPPPVARRARVRRLSAAAATRLLREARAAARREREAAR